MAAVTLQDVLEDLNYLLGDTSVPSTGIDNQKRFINRIIEKIYDYSDWSWSTAATTYVFSGQTQTLPTNYLDMVEVREEVPGADNDNIYRRTTISSADIDASDYIYWVSGDLVSGMTMNINQTDNPSLKTTYKISADELTGTTDTTRIPRSMPIARGALALMQEAEDPYRDTSDAWAKFQRELDDLVRLDIRTKPKVKFYYKYVAENIHMGDPR